MRTLRPLTILVVLSLTGVYASLGQSISTAQAKNHIGDKATVCGKVTGEKTASNSRGTLLSSIWTSPIRIRSLQSLSGARIELDRCHTWDRMSARLE
jgi:hypothetical protein